MTKTPINEFPKEEPSTTLPSIAKTEEIKRKIISAGIDIWNKQRYGEIGWKFNEAETYREFKTADEAEEWGRTCYGSWGKAYKKLIYFANSIRSEALFPDPVEYYCGNVYERINGFLRNQIDNDFNQYRELADTLVLALCSAPRIPTNVVLYRLVCDEFIKSLIARNKEGFPACERGFMSTSLLKGIAKEDGYYSESKNLLKIYVRAGNVGLYVNSVTHRSEEEMLLLPNMYLNMIKYPYRDEESGKMVYECCLNELYLSTDHCGR